MTNTAPDITILSLPAQGRRTRSRLYYFEGNFFMPLTLVGDEIGKVKRAIREFCKANTDMIKRDRSAPGYKTLVELFDEQVPHV